MQNARKSSQPLLIFSSLPFSRRPARVSGWPLASLEQVSNVYLIHDDRCYRANANGVDVELSRGNIEHLWSIIIS